MESWLIELFLHSSPVWRAHRHADHATCDICSNRPHLRTVCSRMIITILLLTIIHLWSCCMKRTSRWVAWIGQVWICRCWTLALRQGSMLLCLWSACVMALYRHVYYDHVDCTWCCDVAVQRLSNESKDFANNSQTTTSTSEHRNTRRAAFAGNSAFCLWFQCCVCCSHVAVHELVVHWNDRASRMLIMKTDYIDRRVTWIVGRTFVTLP